MSNHQLWLQCQNLSHHSLQAFLLSLIDKPHVYSMYEFLKHPQITSVDPKALQFFKLFVYHNYNSLTENTRKQLANEKAVKLKKLTILTLFEGLKEISLLKVSEAILSCRQETIDILVEMSINGIVDIKIDEKHNNVEIHFAQIRARSFDIEDTVALQGKIQNIITKNKRILNVVDETFTQIKNKKSSERSSQQWGQKARMQVQN